MSVLELYVLTGPKKRMGGNIYDLHVVNVENQILNVLVFDETVAGKCKKGEFIAVRGYEYGTGSLEPFKCLKLNHTTKVFHSLEKFHVDDTVVRSFFDSEVVRAVEVKRSPSKRRLSITGNFSKISSLIYGDNNSWCRRDVEIEDGNETIKVKLWIDQKNLLKEENEGAKGTIKNVEVSVFETKGKDFHRSLNSTNETTVLVDEKLEEKTLNIKGTDNEVDHVVLLTSGGDIFTIQKEMAPLKISTGSYVCRVNGTKIVSMVPVEEEVENDS